MKREIKQQRKSHTNLAEESYIGHSNLERDQTPQDA